MRLRLALALLLRVAGASYYDNASLSKHLDDVVPTFPRLPDAGLRKRSPFVVVATQRTGSKWIMKTLRRQTCDVDAESELFTDNHGWDQYNHREAIEAIFDQSLPLPASDGRQVVAQRLGCTCVVGCRQLEVRDDQGRSQFAGKTVETGDFISINGSDGSIYLGKHPSTAVRRQRLT